jgi:DNA-binding cell septation regulator SpoVG
MANITVTAIRKVNSNGSLKAVVDFKLNDSEFYDWRIIQQKDQKAFVSSPANTWENKEGKKQYKNLIKFPKKLHEEIEDKILIEFFELGPEPETDDTPF